MVYTHLPLTLSLLSTLTTSINSAQTKPDVVNTNKQNMGKSVSILLLALILGYGATMAIGFKLEEKEKSSEGNEQEKWFLLPNSEPVLKTNAGEMRVVKSHLGSSLIEKPLHIGFIQMDPNTLFLPLYLDSSLILFVRNGEPTVGLIYNKHLVERQLKVGDVFRIPAGLTFYILNISEDERLHIICSIDPSQSLNTDTFQSFFIGGGTYPASILAGFGPETLSTAFNVSESDVSAILTKQREGPIVYLKNSQGPSIWNKFSKQQDRLKYVKRMIQGEVEEENEGSWSWSWSWSNLFNKIVGDKVEDNDENHNAPKPYNVYKKKLNFKNNYGWAVGISKSEYKPLKHTGIALHLVHLNAGSMFAPHLNTRSTEYGIVLNGSGRVQIVNPNGTLALDTEVKQGDMFWVPRYYAFCQTTSASEPLEIFGFTTSSHKDYPVYLAGANSLLHILNNLELADAFGVSKTKIRRLVNAQHESVILPSSSSSSSSSAAAPVPTDDDNEKEKEKVFAS